MFAILLQIFSNSVADGLSFYQNRSDRLKDVEPTIIFTRRINKLFDVLNRGHNYEGIVTGSKDLEVLNSKINLKQDLKHVSYSRYLKKI